MGLLEDAHLSLLFNRLPFFDHLGLIDLSSLILNSRLLLVYVDVNYIVFVEFLGPSLRNSIFDFILELVHVRVLRKSLCHWLLVKVIKFIVKFSDHVLDVLGFFLLVKLINDSLLDISLSVPWQHSPLWSNNKLSSNLGRERLFFHYLVDRGIFILLKHVNVSVVNVVDYVIIDFT